MRLTTIFAKTLAGAAIASAVAAPLALGQADVLTIRKDGFKRMAASLEAIDKIVKAGQPGTGAIGPAEAIAGHAPRIKALFPEGSGVGETRALPAIWSDRAGFERAADGLVAASALLVAAAESGDQARLAGALRNTAEACANCHRSYRARAR